MPDPLTLECTCSAKVSLCNLVQLVWNVSVSWSQNIIAATSHIYLQSSVSGATRDIFVHGPADAIGYSFNLLPLGDWGDPVAHYLIDESLWQVATGAFISIGATDYIEQTYHCVNVVTGSVTTKIVNASFTGTTTSACLTGPLDMRSTCTGISGTLFKSTPLGACNGCTSTAFNYNPPPVYDVTVNVDDSQEICLCATGGSGDYTYSISSGRLPCGMSLNSGTGCIEGEPDGTCDGISPLVFRVTDAGGAGAPAGGGGPIGGTCGTVGPAVTRISGGSFTTDMTGHIITIAGFAYNITSVTDGDHLSVSPNAGIQPNVPWSYTGSSGGGTAPPPTAPDFAETTCGFLFGCPPSSKEQGNQAF